MLGMIHPAGWNPALDARRSAAGKAFQAPDPAACEVWEKLGPNRAGERRGEEPRRRRWSSTGNWAFPRRNHLWDRDRDRDRSLLCPGEVRGGCGSLSRGPAAPSGISAGPGSADREQPGLALLMAGSSPGPAAGCGEEGTRLERVSQRDFPPGVSGFMREKVPVPISKLEEQPELPKLRWIWGE